MSEISDDEQLHRRIHPTQMNSPMEPPDPPPLACVLRREPRSWWRRILMAALARTRRRGWVGRPRAFCAKCGLPKEPRGSRTQIVCYGGEEFCVRLEYSLG
jgi:hypothetical protein